MKTQHRTTQRNSKLVLSEAEAFTASLKLGSKRGIPHERKKRMLERPTLRSKKGLKNATKIIYEYLQKQKDPVSIDDIVKCLDRQYARRRVYDILNVLHAADVISHNKIDIVLISKTRVKVNSICFPRIQIWSDEECDPLDKLLEDLSLIHI